MNDFAAAQVMSGVWHITDAMGVCMTLLAGSQHALLVDTGYGLADVQTFVRTLTKLPLTVLLTHAHHDHVLGASWFEESCMLQADLPLFAQYTSAEQRARVHAQALAKGLQPPDDFLAAPIAMPKPIAPGAMDLGGLTAQVIACPGHTPGSAMVYVPERRLLLTADNWNPCTWLFFDEALPVECWRENMRGIQKLPFEQVLCSHQPVLFERSASDALLAGLSDEALAGAHPVDMGRSTDTREVFPAPGMNFVFDWSKSKFAKKEK